MIIHLKEKTDQQGQRRLEYTTDEILALKGKMEYTSLLNIISLSEIYYAPDVTQSFIEEDRDLYDFFEIMGGEFEDNEDNISPWVLRLVLDKNLIGVKMGYIEEIIKKYVKRGSVMILHSVDSAEEKKFHIRMRCDPSMQKDEKDRQKSLEVLKMFEHSLLTEVSLYGIESIKKVYVRNVPKIEYYDSSEGDNAGKQKKKLEESVLETDGTNLAKTFEVDEVDFTRTISNDINEIYNVLGIEAVRKSLLRELRNVLKPYGIYVNYRHISILCDLMTQRGYLTSITRHGLNRGESGPIRKATFEETVEILLEAGMFAEKDDLKGISENVLLGKLTKIGTGSFSLLVDVNAFANENKNTDDDDGSSFGKEIVEGYGPNEAQTPVVPSTPGYGGNINIPMSTYDNSGRFTPGPDPSSIASPYYNPGSFNRGTYISSPEQGKNVPSSPEYNPQSDYYKTPAPYSPMANDENNRGQSQYGISAYSPTMSPTYNSGTGILMSQRYGQTGNKLNSMYSPTTPGINKPGSTSPQYIQGSGSGLYNSTPKVQGSGNTSQYHPASPNYYPTSPTYNISAVNNASPFYKQDKIDEDEEEEEEENNDEDDKNNN